MAASSATAAAGPLPRLSTSYFSAYTPSALNTASFQIDPSPGSASQRRRIDVYHPTLSSNKRQMEALDPTIDQSLKTVAASDEFQAATNMQLQSEQQSLADPAGYPDVAGLSGDSTVRLASQGKTGQDGGQAYPDEGTLVGAKDTGPQRPSTSGGADTRIQYPSSLGANDSTHQYPSPVHQSGDFPGQRLMSTSGLKPALHSRPSLAPRRPLVHQGASQPVLPPPLRDLRRPVQDSEALLGSSDQSRQPAGATGRPTTNQMRQPNQAGQSVGSGLDNFGKPVSEAVTADDEGPTSATGLPRLDSLSLGVRARRPGQEGPGISSSRGTTIFGQEGPGTSETRGTTIHERETILSSVVQTRTISRHTAQPRYRPAESPSRYLDAGTAAAAVSSPPYLISQPPHAAHQQKNREQIKVIHFGVV